MRTISAFTAQSEGEQTLHDTKNKMSRARRWTCLAACAALLLLVVFVNPPTHTTLGYVLHKSAHPAVFALIALIYLNLAAEAAQWWKPYLGALSVVLVCGVGTEIAQSLLNLFVA